MGDKKVTAVAGIGPAYGAKLSQGGTDKAYNLLGQFLVHNKDERSFTDRSR
ncbi:barrier to autointegration factor [Ostertagia ostertagi]